MPFHFDNKPSLIAYVTCGDPGLATTREVILAAIDAGASVIELGVPFSDSLADGPVIQRASERALKHGTSLQQVLTLAAEIREHSQSVGLVIFSYLNPILRMGLGKFCQVARLAGIDGTLITDLLIVSRDRQGSVADHAALVSRNVTRIGVFEELRMMGAQVLRGNHGCDDGPTAARTVPEVPLEVLGESQVIPILDGLSSGSGGPSARRHRKCGNGTNRS